MRRQKASSKKVGIIYRSVRQQGNKVVRTQLPRSASSKRSHEVKIPACIDTHIQWLAEDGSTFDDEPVSDEDTTQVPFAEADWGFEESGFLPPQAPECASTSSNAYLRRWKNEYSYQYLAALFARDVPPKKHCCVTCGRHAPIIYQCRSCLVPRFQCSKCILRAHTACPTHSIRQWNGRIWDKASLSQLGLVINLGHNGHPCPASRETNELRVGDISGFHLISVRFCKCTLPANQPRGLQLLSIGIYPCSDEIPQSGFTIEALEHFGIFSTLAKGSAHKYYALLQRLTSPGFPDSVPDRSRELLATHRRFSYLLLLKRSGALYPDSLDSNDSAQMSISCPACPRPEVNFSEQEVSAEERPYMRFWMSFDGNFRNPRKAKKFNDEDVCLTDGSMYYVEQGAYKDWLGSDSVSKGQKSKQRPECDNHKAAQDKFVRWNGLDVTGVGAFTCTRHSLFLPGGFVDFYKGERYAYTDYCFASAVRQLTQRASLEFGMTYDIWCHWITKFKERAKTLPEDLQLPEELDLIGGIPKFHLLGHIIVCWIRYSLNNMKYVGRMEGEGVERAWASLNETSGSTSEKSPGARWDSINLILNDWNFDKQIRMSNHLVGKYQEAVKMFHRQMDIFRELDSSLPAEMSEKWGRESTEPSQDPKTGEWCSPFHSNDQAGQDFQKVIQEEHAKEKPASTLAAQKPGATKWLSTAIELEYSQELLRREIKMIGSDPTPRQHNRSNDRRKAVHERVLSHRAKQDTFMGNAETPDHPSLRTINSSEPEYADLYLPSSYKSETLKSLSFSSLAPVELELRRAVCKDSLSSLKNLLGAKALVLRYKRKNVRGERATTRAEVTLAEHAEKVSRMQWRYNNSRDTLLRLSDTPLDQEAYKRLDKSDLTQLTEYLENESRGLGNGIRAISWIWRSAVAPNNEQWQVNALRTEWFRSRQRFLQWEDELKLLKREMVMTIRSFQQYSKEWEVRSKHTNLKPGMAQYAMQKSHFYAALSDDAMKDCISLIKDPTVQLKWVSEWVSRSGSK